MGGRREAAELGSTVQNWLNAPYYFNMSGRVDSGTLRYVGYNSIAWSATSASESNAYYLNMNDVSSVNPQYNNRRYHGRPLRCVAR